MTDHRQPPHDQDPSLDPALDQTRRTLRRLHTEQQQRPDDAFVRRLETTLMQHATVAPAPPPGIRGVIERLADGIRLREPQGSRRSWAASALSVALLIALVGGTLTAVLRFGGSDGGPPSRTAMFAPSGTPEVTKEQEPGVLWSAPFYAGDADSFGVVLANGTIYRLAASPDFTGIEAVNAADGSLLWSRETSWTTGSVGGTTGANPIAADNERIYIFGSPNQVNALDAETGELVWSYDVGAIGITLQVDNGEVIAWTDQSFVTVIDAVTGDHMWTLGSVVDERAMYAATSPVVTDDLVLAIFEPGALTAISRELGDALWVYDDTFDPLNVSIVEVDGVIILQGNNWETGNLETPRRNIVAALDAADGSVIWRQEIASDPITNIAVSGGSLFIVATNPDQSAATPAPVASPRPEVSGVMWPNVVQALDIATGDLLWTSDQVPSFYRHLFTLADGTVMALTNDAELIGFAPDTGEQVCSLYQLPDYPLSNVIVDSSAIYLSLIDGTLLALDQTQICSVTSTEA